MSNNVNQPAFNPNSAATVNIAVTNVSANTTILTSRFANLHVQVANAGSVTAFIEFGESTVAATAAASMPILPGTVAVYRTNSTHVAAITAASTTTLYFTPGEGL